MFRSKKTALAAPFNDFLLKNIFNPYKIGVLIRIF
jgi:hypothetical protein